MNAPTIIVALIVAAVFVAITVNEVKKHKSGRGGCSCGCAHCGMADVCHSKQQSQKNNAGE